MKKFKITKKEIKEEKPIAIGYCELQNLLKYEEPFAYSTGIYGWDCDYYNINGIIISTGYRPVGIKANRNIIDKYETKAKKMPYNDYESNKINTRKLLNEFIKELRA